MLPPTAATPPSFMPASNPWGWGGGTHHRAAEAQAAHSPHQGSPADAPILQLSASLLHQSHSAEADLHSLKDKKYSTYKHSRYP